MRVGSGSFAPRPLKNFVNFGSTYTARMTTVTIDMPSTTSGYTSADLICALRLDVALDVARELLERRVELAGELRRAQDADVVRREHACVLGDRVRERHTVLDLLAHLAEDLLEALVARALLDDLERVGDRDAGAHERRHLAREVHDLLLRDALRRELELVEALALLELLAPRGCAATAGCAARPRSAPRPSL